MTTQWQYILDARVHLTFAAPDRKAAEAYVRSKGHAVPRRNTQGYALQEAPLTLAQKVAAQRRAHAAKAVQYADLHGRDTVQGRHYLDEAAQWEAAAKKADAGDTNPVNVNLTLTRDITDGGIHRVV